MRNNRTRVKIDRTMIGNPTDFRHTVHGTGGGNLQVCVHCVQIFTPYLNLFKTYNKAFRLVGIHRLRK